MAFRRTKFCGSFFRPAAKVWMASSRRFSLTRVRPVRLASCAGVSVVEVEEDCAWSVKEANSTQAHSHAWLRGHAKKSLRSLNDIRGDLALNLQILETFQAKAFYSSFSCWQLGS